MKSMLKASVIATLLMIVVGARALASTQVIEHSELVYLETSEGMVIIELAPFIAPNHVKRFKDLVSEGFYDGLDFYRVIDGFVAQGGDTGGQKKTDFREPLDAEFTRTVTDKSDFFSVQAPEFLAPETGFISGFPSAKSAEEKLEWLVHCPGAVAMARSTEPNTATTDFYIVIGHAPRHLDRNMSVFGQVVFGMHNVQSVQRGDAAVNGGVIDNVQERSKIIRARLGTSVPEKERYIIQRSSVDSEQMAARFEGARTLSNPFFQYKGSGNIDICYYRPRVTVKLPNAGQ